MKLLDQLALVARRRGLARATQEAYSYWVSDFLRFSAQHHEQWKRPEELGTGDVELFLNHLVGQRHLSASAQNQALCALVFLYQKVLEDVIPQDHLGKFILVAVRSPLDRLGTGPLDTMTLAENSTYYS